MRSAIFAADVNADVEVIATLLSAYPGGAQVRTNNGRLPLQLAADNDACGADVIALLLQAYPDGAGETNV